MLRDMWNISQFYAYCDSKCIIRKIFNVFKKSIMLILATILLLLSNAVNLRRESSILYSRISALILINVTTILFINLNIEYLTKGVIFYGGLMSIKLYTYVFILFILILTGVILGITSVYPNYWRLNLRYLGINEYASITRKKILTTVHRIISKKKADQFRIIEYPLIILFSLTGAIFLMSSSDVISIFLSLELQSYGLYLICSIYRNSESSITAGLTYFLLGGLSSCIILLGLSLLYINTGNTNLENIYMINSISNAFASNVLYQNPDFDNLSIYKHVYIQYTNLQLPLAIVCIGLLFKIASAPFHFWSPDVYDAVPTIVTTFIAIIAKISILILFLQLILFTENTMTYYSWSNIIILSSILSLIVGSVLGLVQYRIKRLYAYSTISHLGFILLALAVNNLQSTRAFFFYIIQYSLSNLNIFIILITTGYILSKYINNNSVKFKHSKYSPVQFIYQLKGLYFLNPVLCLSFIITLFSFLGIPPLVGFFGKQMVLSAAIDNGYMFTTFIAILTSVISAAYYLALIKVIFFESNNYLANDKLFKHCTEGLHDLVNLEIKKLERPDEHLSNKGNPVYEALAFFRSLLKVEIKFNEVLVSDYLSFIISLLTLFILGFMLFDQELIRLIYIIV